MRIVIDYKIKRILLYFFKNITLSSYNNDNIHLGIRKIILLSHIYI